MEFNKVNNVTRDDIAEYINQEFGLTKKDCNDVVNDIIDEIVIGFNNNKIVKIHNFGTFKLRRKKARLGRNPATGVQVNIPMKNKVHFKASSVLLKRLNEN